MDANLHNIRVQQLAHFSTDQVPVSILRLDLLHPVVSGNKWFKLKYFLQEAKDTHKTTIASFGGAYSNHIVATAYAAREVGLNSIGFIRGEKASVLSTTLQNAIDYGMQLVFIERNRYQNKELIMQENEGPDYYWIREGGYGIKGAIGAADILQTADTGSYSHIICATGTGTMMAGLIKAAHPGQEIIGISVLKNNFSIREEVLSLLTAIEKEKIFTFSHDYSFGGYARHPEELIRFMTETWQLEQLPTDIVYTAKLLYAAKDMIARNQFPFGSRLLLIHSGGLQGNESLPFNTLPF
jgi:1-aminocyclopropane-1-carboxylate deaminase